MKKLDQVLGGAGQNHLLPFLWMHGEDEPTLRLMMNKVHDSGIGEVCLESRPHPDYVGDKWWTDVDVVLDEAKKLGMKIWILDDSHFPTGFANGAMLNEPVEKSKQYIAYKAVDVAGPLAGAYLDVTSLMEYRPNPFAGGGLFRRENQRTFDDEALQSVIAYEVGEGNLLTGEAQDITACVKDGAFRWDVPAGTWRVFFVYTTRNGGGDTNYINLLDKDSVRVLIDTVYEPHYAHYKDEFGKTLLGFFSDEPAVGNTLGFDMNEIIGRREMVLPWSPEMPAALGSDFALLFPLLWQQGDDTATAQARYRYMDACSEQISRNFSDQLGAWCEAHGVQYIGHVIEDNNQHARLGCSCGHFFRSMSGMHMAGIDDIGGQVIPGMKNTLRTGGIFAGDGEFFHYSLGKLGASLAQVDENKAGRTMCEIFGAYGWDEGTKEMKHLADHFLARGVNYYVPHAFTGKDFPDPDCPPHFYAKGHNPLYRHFGYLCRYMNRVADLIDGGKPVINAAILYHGESEWMGSTQLMQRPARQLLENQIDFLFWPTDSLEKMPFPVLVVPGCEHIAPKAAEYIKANIEKVLFVDRLPAEISAGKVVPLNELPENVRAMGARGVSMDKKAEDLRIYHYAQEDGEIYLLFNENTSEGVDVWADMHASGVACEYDAYENRLYRAEVDGDKVRIILPPEGATIIVIGQNAEDTRISGIGTVLDLKRAGYSTAETYPAFVPGCEDEPAFSGIVAYEGKFDVTGSRAAICIDDANEGVEVFINGASAGIRISRPYNFDVTALVKPGENDLRIEVTNPLGNAMRAASRRGLFNRPSFIRPLGIIGEARLVCEE